MTGDGLPCGSTQCRKSTGPFHVPGFLVKDSGVPGSKGTAAPLKLVQNTHDSVSSRQSLPDGTMRSKYGDEVEKKGCRDSGKVHGGNLHSNGVGWSGVP